MLLQRAWSSRGLCRRCGYLKVAEGRRLGELQGGEDLAVGYKYSIVPVRTMIAGRGGTDTRHVSLGGVPIALAGVAIADEEADLGVRRPAIARLRACWVTHSERMAPSM